MGLASRQRWDMRAIEYFRLVKLEGPESAMKYYNLFEKTTELEKAMTRVMTRVNYYRETNGSPKAEPTIGRGPTDSGPVPTGGAETLVADAGPTPGEPAAGGNVQYIDHSDDA